MTTHILPVKPAEIVDIRGEYSCKSVDIGKTKCCPVGIPNITSFVITSIELRSDVVFYFLGSKLDKKGLHRKRVKRTKSEISES